MVPILARPNAPYNSTSLAASLANQRGSRRAAAAFSAVNSVFLGTGGRGEGKFGPAAVAAPQLWRGTRFVYAASRPAAPKRKRRRVAEGVGFEPTVPLQARRFSRPVP
jgi:hypothetical protein